MQYIFVCPNKVSENQIKFKKKIMVVSFDFEGYLYGSNLKNYSQLADGPTRRRQLTDI